MRQNSSKILRKMARLNMVHIGGAGRPKFHQTFLIRAIRQYEAMDQWGVETVTSRGGDGGRGEVTHSSFSSSLARQQVSPQPM